MATKVKEPVRISTRKRVSKTHIQEMVKFRGFMTGNEKVQLTTLSVKNSLQRINNRAMSDDVNVNFNGKENELLQKYMKEFVKNVNSILKG